MEWTVEVLEAAEAEIEGLQPGLQARLVRLLEMIENIGLDNPREPHVRQIDGKLWEIRAKAAEGIARGLYVTASGQRVVVLHVFIKKTRKTPAKAIAIARKRMKEVKP